MIKYFLRKRLLLIAFTFFLSLSYSAVSQNYNEKYAVHVGGVTFNMVKVKPGEYSMDAIGGGIITKSVSKEYYIAEFEVTQDLWMCIMGNNPSMGQDSVKGVKFHDYRKRPVENVTAKDIDDFLGKLNSRLSASGLKFRIPSIKEWEYAAVGGHLNKNKYKYSGSNIPEEVGWFIGVPGNDSLHTHPVGKLKANALGLYDMSGNVKELTCDVFATNKGNKRILKGGSFRDIVDGNNSKLANNQEQNTTRAGNVGFRLVMDPPPAVKIRVSTNLLEYEKNGSDDWAMVTVQVNRDHYGVRCSEKWIELDTSNYGRIKIWCKPNNNAFERSAKISITCDTVEEFINVRQKAQNLKFDITPTSRTDIPCDEYSCTFTVQSNGKEYEVGDLPSWITVKEQTSGKLTITCAQNPSEDKERLDSFYVTAKADGQSESVCVKVQQKKQESLKLIEGNGEDRRKVDSVYYSSARFRRKNYSFGVVYNYTGTHGVLAEKVTNPDAFDVFLYKDRNSGKPQELDLTLKRNGTSECRTIKALLRTDSNSRVVPITIRQDTSQVPRTFLNPMFGYDFKNADYLVGLSLSAVPRKINIENRFGFRLSAFYKIEEVAASLNLGLNVRVTKRRSPVGVHVFAAAGPSVDFDDKEVGPVVDFGVRLSWNQYKASRMSWCDLTFGCVYMCGSFIPTIGLGFGPGLIAGAGTGLGFLIKSLVD